MSTKVVGLVPGSRKAGTTWLYENMVSDPAINVSKLVKESRFFLGAISETEYDRLFEKSDAPRIEIDTAIWSDPLSAGLVAEYSSDIRVAIILRHPVDFAVSRYVHARRKGELCSPNQPIAETIRYSADFRSELQYAENIQRFRDAGLSVRVFDYSLLKTDPVRFYLTVRSYLVGGAVLPGHPGLEREAVNTARNGGAASAALSGTAKIARSVGLHRLVNLAKASNLHGRLEAGVQPDEIDRLRRDAELEIGNTCPESLNTWEYYVLG